MYLIFELPTAHSF